MTYGEAGLEPLPLLLRPHFVVYGGFIQRDHTTLPTWRSLEPVMKGPGWPRYMWLQLSPSTGSWKVEIDGRSIGWITTEKLITWFTVATFTGDYSL